jgi:hypothetical protein
VNLPIGISPYDRAFLTGRDYSAVVDVNFPYIALMNTLDLVESNRSDYLVRAQQAFLVLDLHPVHLSERN